VRPIDGDQLAVLAGVGAHWTLGAALGLRRGATASAGQTQLAARVLSGGTLTPDSPPDPLRPSQVATRDVAALRAELLFGGRLKQRAPAY
jgi:hypothetical protein